MKKNIIAVGAYCPDDERKLILERCINSLQPLRKDFDLMISSHSLVPENVSKKVDFVFYDSNNDLIKDWDLCNTPWFSPYSGFTIISSLISNYSTYLAGNRLLCGALGIAKNFGYTRAHWVDYDCFFNEYSEFYENLLLLEDNVSVQYTVNEEDINYVEGGVGVFQAVNLEKVNNLFTTYDRDALLEILKNSDQKTNEVINQKIYLMDGEKVYYKRFDVLEEKGNSFNSSASTSKDDLDDWAVPYYDTKAQKVNVITWNSKKESPIDVQFIINKEKIISMEKISKFSWSIQEVGDIEKIDEILTIVNNKIKNHILINTQELKEKFIRNNYSYYE